MRNLSQFLFRKFLLLAFFCPLVVDAQMTARIAGGDVIAYDLEDDYANPQHQIYTINADGTGNAKLITAAIGLNHLEFSPDGKKIALVGYMDNTNTTWSIHTYDVAAEALKRITNNNGVWDTDPSWSPNGSMIAFTKIYQSQNMKNETWVMNADGSNQRYIGVPGFQPKWSPDGTKLIYAANSSGNWEIYSCNIDGSGIQRLTNNTSDEFGPSWSPDGKKILFTSSRDGNSEIYVMNSDGSQQQRLTNNAADDGSPKWSPDGTQIVFSSDRGRAQYKCNLYVMDADGSNLKQLTNLASSQASAICPTWKPGSTTPVDDGSEDGVPRNCTLYQNYPNPFNPATTIRYELPRTTHAKLEVYDLLGCRVKVLVDAVKAAGSHAASWDGSDHSGHKGASGMYIIRLTTSSSAQACRALLTK